MSKAKDSKKILLKDDKSLKLKIKVGELKEYKNWFLKETEKSQLQIQSRMHNIKYHEHFGDVKDLSDGLAELRWRSGRRIYFASTGDKIILLLIGGNKNGQDKDIKKARLLIRKNENGNA